MKEIRIIFNYTSEIIEVDSNYDWMYENPQDLIDTLIDRLESEGKTGCFIDWTETVDEGGEHYEDEYVVDGNHGLLLYHGGNFMIEEVLNNEY